MKTVRTVMKVIERDEVVKRAPKFNIGDYMLVYYGQWEGHNFSIKEVRFNHDRESFEYLYDGLVMGGWMSEDQVVLVKEAAA